MLNHKAVVPYLYHKTCRGQESFTKGSGKQKWDRGGILLTARSRVPPHQPPLSAGEEGPPWGPDPCVCGDRGCGDPSGPQGCWESPRLLPGMLRLQPLPLPSQPPERWPDGNAGNSWCSACLQLSLSSSLQHRRD